MSFSPKFTIANSIAAGLTKAERARGFLEAAKLSKDWIAEIQNRAHPPKAIDSNDSASERHEEFLDRLGWSGTQIGYDSKGG